jgi:anti-sigma-K factor RskA
MSLDRERLEELAALTAAGAATLDESAELDDLIEAHPEALVVKRELDDAAAMLAMDLQPVAPPAGMLERIRGQIRNDQTAADTGASSTAGPGADIISLVERRKNRAVVAAVASMAAAAAFALLWFQERGNVEDLREDMTARLGQRDRETGELERELQAEIVKARQEAEVIAKRYEPIRSNDVRLATVSNETGATMKIFIDESRRRWLVFAFELPALPADQDYQLWLLPKEGAPVSAGLLEIGPDGELMANPQFPPGVDAAKAAISIEPKGGSPQPTGDIPVIGDLI